MSESNENHIIEVDEEFVPYEPSKLEKIKTAATIGAFYTFAGGVTAGSFYLSWKLTKMNLEAAKMNLEAARLAAQK